MEFDNKKIIYKDMEKKVQNLLSFTDFERSWKTKEQKKTKRTDTGLDVVEKKKIFDEEDLDEEDLDIEDIDDIDDDIVDDEIGDDIENEMDDDSEWQDQLSALIDEIIEGGEEPEEVLNFVQDYIQDEDSEGEEIDIEDDEFDEEDLDEEDLDEEDLDDEEIVVDDEEGEEVQESFRHWRKK